MECCGTVIPLDHALLRGSSDLPGGGGAPSRHAPGRNRIPSLFGLAPCGVCPARRITASAVRSYRTFSPLPRSVKTDPERPGRYIFCGTFRRTGLNPASRTLSGTLLCGVRTFLSPHPKIGEATVRSSCLQSHYMPEQTSDFGRRTSGGSG